MHRNRPRPGWLGGAYAVNFYSVRRTCSQCEDSAEYSQQVHAGRDAAQWNWPSSVEPVSAVVDELGSTVVAIRSK
jgi:hypothetical protein